MTQKAGDVAEIAGRLTEAQRRVIVEMSDGEFVHRADQTAADAGVSLPETRAAMRQFRHDGIADYGPLWSEDEGKPVGSGTWLNRFGLAVRNHILQEKEGV